ERPQMSIKGQAELFTDQEPQRLLSEELLATTEQLRGGEVALLDEASNVGHHPAVLGEGELLLTAQPQPSQFAHGQGNALLVPAEMFPLPPDRARHFNEPLRRSVPLLLRLRGQTVG